jgi:CheY-like chemotaxis protein
MHIVYIEDNDANVALIERIVQMTDDTLETYSDPESALANIIPGKADLILMDLHLGNRTIDGLQLTRLLRQKGVQEPIIAITAYDTNGWSNAYLDAGCNAYVRKPVSVNSLLSVIDQYRLS